MGNKKKQEKKARKAEKIRAERMLILSATCCSPKGCKSKCCKKYQKCESKRCKKCPCTDLLKELQRHNGLSQVA